MIVRAGTAATRASHITRTGCARGGSRTAGTSDRKDGYLLIKVGAMAERTLRLCGRIHQRLKTFAAILADVFENRHQ